MFQVKDTLISDDVIEKHFVCDLSKCKGACCIKGDAGAPLTADEVSLLPKIIEKIKPYLRHQGVKAIEKQGTHVIDRENETVTPLVNEEECAYVVFDGEIAKCGIEKAFNEGAIDFQKPVSCHLYPVRIRKFDRLTAVNYDTWDICAPARENGQNMGVTVASFVKDALIRRFGSDWYKHLSIAVKEISGHKKRS